MSLSFLRCLLLCALAVIVLAAAVGLYIFIDVQSFPGDAGIDSEDDAWKARLRGTHLDFIAETGRVVVNDRGVQEIVWDPPELPSLRESILRGKLARMAMNPDLLPLCTEEYLQYLKARKKPKVSGTDWLKFLPRPSFPACNGIPDGIYRGPPSGPGYLDRRDGP